MSSLQIGLVILGLVVVLAVLLYNRRLTARAQPRRARPTVQSDPDGPHPQGSPGSAAEERREPTLGAWLAEAGSEAAPAPAPLAHSSPVPPASGAVLSADLDALVPLAAELVVSGDAILAALPGTRRIGGKPFFIEGLNPETRSWEFPRAGQRYTQLQAGIQLANRMGPLNEIEFSEFVVKLQAFADALQLTADFPEMMTEVARARELDHFAVDHDAQLSFTIRATRAAWSPGYLTQHAALQGFVAGAMPGRMVLPAAQPGAAPVLILQYETQAALAEDPDQAALRFFSINLDVPHVARSERPFVRMREVAVELSRAMEGSITDDSGQVLDGDAMDRIGADLEVLYDALDARGLPVGAALTRRLFR